MLKGFVVCIGKSHKILQSLDSKTCSGLCLYHSSAISNHHFYIATIFHILGTLSCLTYLCSPSALVLSILTQYVHYFFNNTTHMTDGLNIFPIDCISHISCTEGLVLYCYNSSLSSFSSTNPMIFCLLLALKLS